MIDYHALYQKHKDGFLYCHHYLMRCEEIPEEIKTIIRVKITDLIQKPTKNEKMKKAIEAALRDLQQYAHVEQTIESRRLMREALEKGLLCGTE